MVGVAMRLFISSSLLLISFFGPLGGSRDIGFSLCWEKNIKKWKFMFKYFFCVEQVEVKEY
jgi:hypothetical protein